jgi:hypothetical protein
MSLIDEKMKELKLRFVFEDRTDPTSQQVTDVEGVFGRKFPFSYEYFVKKYGGTSLDRGTEFTIYNSPPFGNGEIDVFFQIAPKKMYDIGNELETYRNRLPDFFLPIAQDAFGNLICIEVDSVGGGKVYFWDHTQERFLNEGEKPDRHNIWFVADSFEDFIQMLCPEHE